MAAAEQEQKERRSAALTAGMALIVMAVAAGISYGFIHGQLVVKGDPAATLDNVRTSGALLRAEILGWLVVLLCDIAVAWGFYIFLKPVHRHLSLLPAWLRISYAAILGIAVNRLMEASILAARAPDGSAWTQAQLQAQVMLNFEAFDATWSFGLIVFGVHLLLAGWLAFHSGSIPRIIGVLLLIAGTGYMAVNLIESFLTSHETLASTLESVLIAPMTAGELGFGLWLLFKGGRPAAQTRRQSIDRNGAAS